MVLKNGKVPTVTRGLDVRTPTNVTMVEYLRGWITSSILITAGSATAVTSWSVKDFVLTKTPNDRTAKFFTNRTTSLATQRAQLLRKIGMEHFIVSIKKKIVPLRRTALELRVVMVGGAFQKTQVLNTNASIWHVRDSKTGLQIQVHPSPRPIWIGDAMKEHVTHTALHTLTSRWSISVLMFSTWVRSIATKTHFLFKQYETQQVRGRQKSYIFRNFLTKTH